MKRLIYCLIALPLLMITSCSNDDELPDVTFNVSFSGATNVDGVFYVVEGDAFAIDGISVKPVSGGEAAIGAVTYGWNYMEIGSTITPPFNMAINTAVLGVSDNVLQIEASVLQVDKSIAIAYFKYPVKIVASADDIPSGEKVYTVSMDGNATLRSGTGAKFD
jgi:hypothetical protein